MTDQQTDQGQSPPPNTPPNTEGGGGAPPPTSWLDNLPEAMRADPNLAKFKSVDDLAKSWLMASKRMGAKPEQMLMLPEKLDDAEAMAAIYDRLGRPEKAEAYKVEFGEKASDADKGFINGFLPVAHQAGLNQAQLNACVAYVNQVTQEGLQADAAAAAAAEKAAEAELRKEFGAKFDTYQREIGAFLVKHGGQGLADELKAGGLGNSVGLTKLLAMMVDRLAEPEAPGGGDPKINDGQLTPAQAKAALTELETHPALRDKFHPQHSDVLAKRRQLLAWADGKAA